jgi:hypothetical protein
MTNLARTGPMLAAVLVTLGPLARAVADEHKQPTKATGESSPFIVGVWKFVPTGNESPSVDTEFRFINPTDLTLNIEYAFFELDGTFCGCDRDVMEPNKTVIYTVLQESQTPTPVPTSVISNLFSCKGTSGALKSIVFKNKGNDIFLDDATQVGFQTTAFAGIVESNLFQGSVMTESGLKGIAVTDATKGDIRRIHEQCVTVQGPLSQDSSRGPRE